MNFYSNINMDSTYVEKYFTLLCFHLVLQAIINVAYVNPKFKLVT